jgi:Fungal Zn(2)-Cys(6) binuclear cluster domain
LSRIQYHLTRQATKAGSPEMTSRALPSPTNLFPIVSTLPFPHEPFRPYTNWAEGVNAPYLSDLAILSDLESAPYQSCSDVGEFSDLDRIIQMEIQSPSSSNATDKGESPKQAACLNCRRSKTRCLRDSGDLKCKKCAQTRAECIVPEYRVGRKKGIKK